jgi:DNA-binding NarL/FixJ family response regulator
MGAGTVAAMGGSLRTRARIRHKKLERVLRQAHERITETLSGDQRHILQLSQQGYQPGEIARELALDVEYVEHFMTGLVQRLTHERLIPSPEWRNVITWAADAGILTVAESQ